MVNTMLFYFYLFVFQNFSSKNLSFFILFSSSKIQLFHSSPLSISNYFYPCAICFAFIISSNNHLKNPLSIPFNPLWLCVLLVFREVESNQIAFLHPASGEIA